MEPENILSRYLALIEASIDTATNRKSETVALLSVALSLQRLVQTFNSSVLNLQEAQIPVACLAEVVEAAGGDWCLALYDEGMTTRQFMLAVIREQNGHSAGRKDHP